VELSDCTVVVFEQGSDQQFCQVESCGLFVLLDEAVEFADELCCNQILVRAWVALVGLLLAVFAEAFEVYEAGAGYRRLCARILVAARSRAAAHVSRGSLCWCLAQCLWRRG